MNDAAQHTPGPWTIGEYTDGGAGVFSAALGLCRVHTFMRPEEDRANARLIAAAPELLEALQRVMSAHGEQLTDAFDQAHRAIAKATGAANV